jgi:hypothetical protein
VRLVQRKNLTMGFPRIAKSRDVVSLQIRLATLVALKRVVTVQPIIRAELMTDVQRPLIECSRARLPNRW